MQNHQKKDIFITPGRKLWPHEIRVAKILTAAGYDIKFLSESNLHTADILLDGVEYEIKSPKSSATNSLEHLLKKALKQSPNIIIDISRIKNVRSNNMANFLCTQAKSRRQIKKLIMITKQGEIIDIMDLT